MSDANPKRRRPARDLDVSIPGGKQKTSWKATFVIWGVVATIFLAFYYLEFSLFWTLVMVVPGVFLTFIAWITWMLVIRRGVFTWMKLAGKPAKLFAEGDAAGAEAALQQALARARQFGPNDHPRGMMLAVLAEYLGYQARVKEAIELFEEATAILAQHSHKNPMDYFIGLNNYAVLLIHVKDHIAGQQILERVLDLTLLVRQENQSEITSITPAQLHMIEFILHINLVCIFIDIDEAAECRYHLEEASAAFDALPRGNQASFHDHFAAMRARWLLTRDRSAEAEEELAAAKDPEQATCVRVRARMHLMRQEFSAAEPLLKQVLEFQKKKGVLHHPDLFDVNLDLAECQQARGAFEAAVVSLQEARSLVRDFGLPRNERYRDKLKPWVERAHQQGQPDLAVSLQEELRSIPASGDARITVLARFRLARDQNGAH